MKKKKKNKSNKSKMPVGGFTIYDAPKIKGYECNELIYKCSDNSYTFIYGEIK